jgi:hypothetical protein
MSLKVFDLQCESGHVFEGWFASSDSYDSQRASGLLVCPMCNSTRVERKLSASRINTGHARRAAPSEQDAPATASTAAVAAPAGQQLAQLQAEMMRQVRGIINGAENVGDRFTDEARRMHDGETKERAIRGTATQEQRESLARDGIAVMPIPDFLDDEHLQ